MLGRSAPPNITYVRPVGGPENTSNIGENPNINNLAWPPRPSPYPPRRIFCPKIIHGTFLALSLVLGWGLNQQSFWPWLRRELSTLLGIPLGPKEWNLLEDLLVGKDLAPHRIGKHSNPQNRPKIHQKYSKNTIFSIFGIFFPYFACGGVFLFCRGPSFSQSFSGIEMFKREWRPWRR